MSLSVVHRCQQLRLVILRREKGQKPPEARPLGQSWQAEAVNRGGTHPAAKNTGGRAEGAGNKRG